MRTKKNSITDKKIKIYLFYQIYFRKKDYDNYQIAKKYVEQLSLSSQDDKEKLMQLSGFKKNDSLLDLFDNILHFLFIVLFRSFNFIAGVTKKYTQSLVAYYQNNQYKIKKKKVKKVTDRVIDTMSADKKNSVKIDTTIEKDVGFVEIAVWVNSNTEKNKRMFIFNYGDIFDFYGKKEKYFIVQQIIVMTMEDINMPNSYTYNKPYYYKEI